MDVDVLLPVVVKVSSCNSVSEVGAHLLSSQRLLDHQLVLLLHRQQH